MSEVTYGKAPTIVSYRPVDWDEYMHWMYLPIRMDGVLRLPPNLGHLRGLVVDCLTFEEALGNEWRYVYLTARRGYATPGNPLNRPGWHCDGFGTTDVNYIWHDGYPTLFAVQDFTAISDDHVASVGQFEAQIDPDRVVTYPDRRVLRLDPFVVHAAPEIPAPGGERSFVKVSFSNDRYNLRGNSHNHEFDYEWKMWDRLVVRNDPAYAGGDAGPQEARS